MRSSLIKCGLVCVAILLSGTGAARGRPPQDESPAASEIQKLQIELQLARDEQSRQLSLIEALTAQAAVAQQASQAAELQAAQMYKAAEARLNDVQSQAANVTGHPQDQALSNEASQQSLLLKLAQAKDQHAALLDLLALRRADTNQAQHTYQQLQDAQANAALQGFVINRVTGRIAGEDPSQECWIGVQCEPALEVVVQLESANNRPVTIKGGLRVNAVTENSPAQSAGVVEQDVILYMNDRPTNQIEELVAVIDENGEKEATLFVVREERPIHLTITPLKRPTDTAPSAQATLHFDPHYLRYGQLLHLSAVQSGGTIPEGFEADIHFAWNATPEFHIKSSDQSWVVNGENMESLPEPVRGFAQSWWSTLNSGRSTQVDLVPQYYSTYSALPPVTSNIPYLNRLFVTQGTAVANQESELHAKLDQIQTQVNELRQLLEAQQK